ncbi:hypothetical protein DPEC_G00358320 [Dallia pectoralis]|uniref:Uncharacterized protein n=1 Tax=Dallia pectoralis TaxID=75939 RepID=A0ACC2F068_DALPE|nr:hypothetical protein DPEC_G00358320 [Dallia pectoralis]
MIADIMKTVTGVICVMCQIDRARSGLDYFKSAKRPAAFVASLQHRFGLWFYPSSCVHESHRTAYWQSEYRLPGLDGRKACGSFLTHAQETPCGSFEICN